MWPRLAKPHENLGPIAVPVVDRVEFTHAEMVAAKAFCADWFANELTKKVTP
jgi:hypothetical protein